MAIQQVADSANMVTSTAQSLSASVTEVGKGSEQITETINQVSSVSRVSKVVQSGAAGMEQLSRSIQEVAHGAQTQAKVVDETVGIVQQISAAIEEVAKSAQNAVTTSQQVSVVATEGGQQVAQQLTAWTASKTPQTKLGRW